MPHILIKTTEFHEVTMTHDEAVEKLLIAHKVAEKKHYTDLFLSGISGPTLNSGLCAYAKNKNFISHTHIYTGTEPADYPEMVSCQICGCYLEGGYYDSALSRGLYFEVAGPDGNMYKDIYVMEMCNKIENISPIQDSDFAMFKEIMLHLKNAEPNDKINSVLSKLKYASFFPILADSIKSYNKSGTNMWKDTARNRVKTILEILGLCGILHTEEHKGSFYEYANWNTVHEEIRNKTNWRYPVAYWKGKDAIDWKAFEYWFGEYDALKDI